MGEDVVEGLLRRNHAFACDFCKIGKNKAEVFGKKVTANLCMETVEDSLKVLMSMGECFVVAGRCDDDIRVGNFGCHVNEALAKDV
jgi:hypothetical protein